MRKKAFLKTFSIFIMLLIFIWFIPHKLQTSIYNNKIQQKCIPYYPCEVSIEAKELSNALNEAMRSIGILSCKLTELKSKSDVIASTRGGWCSNISGKNSSQHLTDHQLAIFLSGILKGKKVASFGDGPGMYKKIMIALGEVAIYDAYDGAPFAEETTNGEVKHLDLSVPIYHLPLYDWIISLEVAEHIPVEYEKTFIDNLTRHAREGIILSWARIGQTGHSHVNNRNAAYVIEQIEKRGFSLNLEKSNMLKEATTFEWLRLNTYIYLRVKNI